MTDAAPRSPRAINALAWPAGLLALGWLLRDAATPFLLALAIAYLLHPAVAWIERRGLRRATAIAVLYAASALAAAGLLAFLVPAACRQLGTLVQATFRGEPYADLNANGAYDPGEPLQDDLNRNARRDRAYVDKLADFGRQTLRRWNETHPGQAISVDALLDRLREGAESGLGGLVGGLSSLSARVIALAAAGFRGLLILFSYAVLVPIYTALFLRHGSRIRNAILRAAAADERPRLARVLDRLHAALAAFFRGQVLCGAAKGAVAAAGLTLVGAPHGLLFGLLYGAAGVCPYLGLVTVFPLMELFTVLDAGGVVLARVLGIIAVVAIAELLEGAVFVPRLHGRTTGLPPVALWVCLPVFGELFGLFGLLAAVPLTAAAKILFEEYAMPLPAEAAPEDAPKAAATPPPRPPASPRPQP